VFIIDDEVDMCMLLKSYFLRKGYRVFIAPTVEEALPTIRMEKPDFVIVDRNSCKNLKKEKAAIEEAAPGVQVFVTGIDGGINLSDHL
jgi:DNA-binding response OmpR family regulator